MAISTTAFSASPARTTSKPKREPVLFRDATVRLEYEGLVEIEDASWDDATKTYSGPPVKKLKATFLVLLEGADAAQAAVEQMAAGPDRDAALATYKKRYAEKGHGLRVYWQAPMPNYIRVPKQDQKPTRFYAELLKGMFAAGGDLSPDQVKNIVQLLRALEGVGADDKPIAGFVRPQFWGALKKDTVKGKMVLTHIVEPVPEEDVLPSWRPMAHLHDPREDTLDDPTIVCSETGDRVYGFEVERDGEKVWVSNKEFAEAQVKKIGRVLRNDLYRKALREKEAAERDQAKAAAAPVAASADEMPF